MEMFLKIVPFLQNQFPKKLICDLIYKPIFKNNSQTVGQKQTANVLALHFSVSVWRVVDIQPVCCTLVN